MLSYRSICLRPKLRSGSVEGTNDLQHNGCNANCIRGGPKFSCVVRSMKVWTEQTLADIQEVDADAGWK